MVMQIITIIFFSYPTFIFTLPGMAKQKATHEVISAGRTDDGAPVYLTSAGSWTTHLAEAAPIADGDRLKQLLEDAARREREVCDPYHFGVTLEGDVVTPLSQRERIRAAGPTTRVRRPD
jgi:hypothetical protein